MRVTPIINYDFLLLIVTIPLIDTSLLINLYTVNNLPALYSDLQFTYVWEGLYIVVSKHGMYTAIPPEYEIHICETTKGHLWMINHALYPIEPI